MKCAFKINWCILLVTINGLVLFGQSQESNSLDTLTLKMLMDKGKNHLDLVSDSAIWYYSNAIEILETQEQVNNPFSDKKLWECHNGVAQGLFQSNQLKEAEEYLSPKLARVSITTISASSSLAACFYTLAETYFKQGNLNNSIGYFKKSLLVYQILNDTENISTVNYHIGRVYMFTGLKDSTLLYIDRALSFKLETSDTLGIMECYSVKGGATYQKGEFKEALSILKEADRLGSISQNDTLAQFAAVLSNMSVSYWALGDLDNALAGFTRAINLKQRTETDKDAATASILTNMGILAREQGDYPKALQFYFRAISIFEKLLPEDHFRFGQVFGNIGAAYIYNKEYDKALLYLEKARTIFESNPSYKTFLGSTYLNLGSTYTDTNQKEIAYEYLNKAIKAQEDLKGKEHAELADFITALGDYYFQFREYPKAIDTYHTSLDMYKQTVGNVHPDIARVYNLLGKTYLELEDYQNALRQFNKAISAILPSFDDVNLLASPVDAEQSQVKALLLEVMRYKGDILLTMFKKDETKLETLLAADQHFKIASQYIDDLRQTFLVEDTKESLNSSAKVVYELGIETSLLLSKYENTEQHKFTAFEYAEKSKASNLLFLIQANKIQKYANVPSGILEQEKEIKKNLAYYQKALFEENLKLDKADTSQLKLYQEKIFDYSDQRNVVLNKLKKEYPRYYQLKYNIELTTVQNIQKQITEEEGVVEYFIGDKNIYYFIITKTDFIVDKIDKNFPLDRFINGFHNSIYVFQVGKNQSTESQMLYADSLVDMSYLMYDKLVKPIVVKLPKRTKKLLMIPDGVIGYIPFEILLASVPEQSLNFASHDYLLKHYQFSYCYSATMWLEMKERKYKIRKEKVLAFAPLFKGETNAVYRSIEKIREGLGLLRFNIPEAEATQRLIGGKLYSKELATLSNFKKEAPSYNIIHLATHGKSNDKTGDFSYLVFSSTIDSLDHEYLYTKDLYDLELQADMVVLSACETGIGELQEGEGIISLARGFSYAGAKSIITSLWSVNDQSTYDLMESFYEYIKAGESKDAAIRQAKLDYLSSSDNYNAHPFNWGAFICIGDTSPIHFGQPLNYFWLILGGLTILLLVYQFLLKNPLN